MKPLSPQELHVWNAFRLMHEDVLARVGRDIAQATGLSGPEFGVLSGLQTKARGRTKIFECLSISILAVRRL